MIKYIKKIVSLTFIVLVLIIIVKMFLVNPLISVLSFPLGGYLAYKLQKQEDKTMFLICIIYFIYLVYYYTIRYVIAFFKALYLWVIIVFKFVILNKKWRKIK